LPPAKVRAFLEFVIGLATASKDAISQTSR
jgi:hypothetical protein